MGQINPEVLHGLRKGIHCPSCGRWAQKYKRHIYATMVETLIRLYRISKRNPDKRFFHIDEFVKDTRGVAFATTSYWGLVKRQPLDHDDTAKKTSGMWALTKKGRQFLRGEIEIEKYAFVYNDTVIDFSDETFSVHEALNGKFDYSKLMSGKYDN